jgi:hypothetical protein
MPRNLNEIVLSWIRLQYSVLCICGEKGRWLRVCTYSVLSSIYTNLPTVLFRDTAWYTLTKEKEAYWRNDPDRILPSLCKRQVEVDLVIYHTGCSVRVCMASWHPYCKNLLHCNKKWTKRSFPLENYPSEEGKFPCGCWNIYPATHTVFIHSSCRKSVPVYGRRHFTGLRRLTSWNCPQHRYFREISRIPCFSRTFSGKFLHSRGKNVLPAGSSWKSLPYETKD